MNSKNSYNNQCFSSQKTESKKSFWNPMDFMPDEKGNIKNKKTFCIYPFIHSMYSADGHARLCCVANEHLKKKNNTTYYMGSEDPEKVWNSTSYREVRRQMFSGKKISYCSHCYLQEKLGGRNSYRQDMNLIFLKRNYREESLKRVKEAFENDFHVSSPPFFLHLVLGNLCNLKCRMCFPSSSSLIFKEYENLNSSDKKFSLLLKDNCINMSNILPWYEKPSFFETIYRWLPQMRKLYFTGGEPLLMKKNLQLIEYCVKKGYAHNMEIYINTNCTIYGKQFVENLKYFKKIQIHFSIDGFKKVQEYIRNPSKWNKIVDNVEGYLQNAPSRTHFCFNPVFQVYNSLDFCYILDWILKLSEKTSRNLYVDPIILNVPGFLSVNVLPEKALNKVKLRLSEWLDKNKKKINKESLNAVKTLLAFCERPLEKKRKLQKELILFTKTLDKKRGQSLKESIPSIYEAFKDDLSLKG